MSGGRIVVTGGAGFIGSHLVDQLIQEKEVVCLDNLSSGSLENLASSMKSSKLELKIGDVENYREVLEATKECETIFHFAANPEVRLGDPKTHFDANLRGTFNVLEAARVKDMEEIVFASSSTVYGDARTIPTPEDYAPLRPISVYGASKLACEALLSSYSHTYGIKGVALRYANIVGPRLKRGVIYDFVRKLGETPTELEILGDGTQEKSYMWIHEAVDATLFVSGETRWRFETFNIGSKDRIDVVSIAKIVVEEMGLSNVKLMPSGGVDGGRGWVGDVKCMLLSIEKLESLGWKPRYNSERSVRLTAKALVREAMA